MICGYPQPGKAKSEEILAAFCERTRGGLIRDGRLRLGSGAAFYGTIGIEPLFRQAQAAGDWYYLDNAFFDAGRGQYFRVGRNALQTALRHGDRRRLENLGITVKPWRKSGRHILIVEQSDYFMREIACWQGGLEAWRFEAIKTIEAVTDRPIIVRVWPRDKIKASRTLQADLADAWAVVVYSSAVANEAILAGIPVFAMGQCPAAELGNRDIAQIEAPILSDDSREEWAARLASSQWTLEEMRAGMAWRALIEEQSQ